LWILGLDKTVVLMYLIRERRKNMAEQFMVYNPGRGYRLLSVGEKIRRGDEVHHKGGRKWCLMDEWFVGEEIHVPGHAHGMPFGYYRRKIGA